MEVRSLKSTIIYLYAVLRIIRRIVGPRVFLSAVTSYCTLVSYMFTKYVYLGGFTHGRGSVWKISHLKNKRYDRPTRTPIVNCDSDAI